MSGSGGSYSQSESKQRTYIDPFQRKKLNQGYKAAYNEILQNPQEIYAGQTVAGPDAATTEGQNAALLYGRGAAPGALGDASKYSADVLSGQYLDPASNPYLRGTYDVAARAITDNYNQAVLPGIESRFARAGQSQSSQYLGARSNSQNQLARSLGETATQLYGGAYAQERGLQDSASRFAPTLAGAISEDALSRSGAIRGVGDERTAYQQSILDDLLQRYQFAQDEPYNRISRYQGILGNPTVLGNQKANSFSVSVKGGQ